jgi:hypothetical protein
MTTTEPEKPYCLCQCGIRTKGGQFVPGHDARYKSQLIATALGDDEEAAAHAERIIEGRGWTKFLDKRREVLAGARTPKTKVDNSTPKSTEYLYLMKAAAKILRWTGQYAKNSRSYIKISPINAWHLAKRLHPLLELPDDGTEPEEFTEWEAAAIQAGESEAESWAAEMALEAEEAGV